MKISSGDRGPGIEDESELRSARETMSREKSSNSLLLEDTTVMFWDQASAEHLGSPLSYGTLM
jgi:hypothetical protein